MGLLSSFKKWMFGGDDEEQEESRDFAAKEIARRAPRAQPVISDALEANCGGLQGLAWFWSAFVCDEWGNVATDLLETSKEGLSRRNGKKVGIQNIVYSCVYGVVDVRIVAPKSHDRTHQGSSTTTKSRPNKHKKRNRAR